MGFMAFLTMGNGGHYITMLSADSSISTQHDPLPSSCHSEKMLWNPSICCSHGLGSHWTVIFAAWTLDSITKRLLTVWLCCIHLLTVWWQAHFVLDLIIYGRMPCGSTPSLVHRVKSTVKASIVYRSPHPAFVACSTKSGGKAWKDLSHNACRCWRHLARLSLVSSRFHVCVIPRVVSMLASTADKVTVYENHEYRQCE